MYKGRPFLLAMVHSDITCSRKEPQIDTTYQRCWRPQTNLESCLTVIGGDLLVWEGVDSVQRLCCVAADSDANSVTS